MSHTLSLRSVLAVALLFVGAPASPYKIGSGMVELSPDLHEQFTMAARQCLETAGGKRPTDCRAWLAKAVAAAREARAKPSNLESYAVRWPDDPTRMLDRVPSSARFGAKLLASCPSVTASTPLDEGGLTCSSHFGRLQFLHAQSTAGDTSPETTRQKILGWAAFAFDGATDPSFRDKSYCEATSAIPNADLRHALTLSSDSWCRDRARRFLGIKIGTNPGWTVRTLFALHCPNVAQEKLCWERNNAYGDESARAATVGALLHLVQDSYSQSHVARTAPGAPVAGARGPFTAHVACFAPVRYYDYLEQSKKLPDDRGQIVKDSHGVADERPTLDASCDRAERPVDDVITASAAVLYFVGQKDRGGMLDYLARRVFP